MGIADACQALIGWRCLDVRVIDEPEGPVVAWEFASRSGSKRIRLLFAGLQLASWDMLTPG
jgi:hypothetical protein